MGPFNLQKNCLPLSKTERQMGRAAENEERKGESNSNTFLNAVSLFLLSSPEISPSGNSDLTAQPWQKFTSLVISASKL